MVDKTRIISEIQQTARENGGKPPGRSRFQHETGIRESDWRGMYWARWSDALAEAGFGANAPNTAYPDDFLLEQLALLTQQLGRFPVASEIKMKGRREKFPSHGAFHRLGRKQEIITKLVAFCHNRGGFNDVLKICSATSPTINPEKAPVPPATDRGFVYLMKAGRYYKIGRTNSLGRREYEIALQLPEKATVVHRIVTDDPPGIESYWHNRFKSSRKNGEWFELTARQTSDFRRRKFM